MRRRRARNNRIILFVTSILIGLLLATPAFGAYVNVTYSPANHYCNPNCNPSSGWAYWKTNKVWRPIGNWFGVWFTNDQSFTAGYRESADARTTQCSSR